MSPVRPITTTRSRSHFIGMPDAPDKSHVLAAEAHEHAARAHRLAAQLHEAGDRQGAAELSSRAERQAHSAGELSRNAHHLSCERPPAVRAVTGSGLDRAGERKRPGA